MKIFPSLSSWAKFSLRKSEKVSHRGHIARSGTLSLLVGETDPPLHPGKERSQPNRTYCMVWRALSFSWVKGIIFSTQGWSANLDIFTLYLHILIIFRVGPPNWLKVLPPLRRGGR